MCLAAIVTGVSLMLLTDLFFMLARPSICNPYESTLATKVKGMGSVYIVMAPGQTYTFDSGVVPAPRESCTEAVGIQAPGRERVGSVPSKASPGGDARPRSLTLVIPARDEQETLVELYRRIEAAVGSRNPFEVVFVDDGSRDGTWQVIRALQRQRPGIIRGIRFRRNLGKAAALTAGFRAARGQVIFTMDADLQDEPAEIPRFLEKLDQGFDMVSGWKRVRHDPWHKVFPSRVFNWMLSRLSGVRLHDHNCGFKCYRAEVVRNLTLYGEQHRIIACLAALDGYRTGEIEVEHHPRMHGRTKYGIERFLRGFCDMLSVWFLRNFGERPAHFTGAVAAVLAIIAIGLMLIGGLIETSLSIGLILVVLGGVCLALVPALLSMGLIAELLNRGGLQELWKLRIAEDTAGIAEQSGQIGIWRPAVPLSRDYRAPRTAAASEASSIEAGTEKAASVQVGTERGR